MLKENIESKTWSEFRETGLFLFINSILHAFGWVIVIEWKDGKGIAAYPARTKFRGFDNSATDEAHKKIANYLAENANNFPEEIK
ncbi:hypothetical protein DBR40_09070 [Pedobacter sp. KBW01]|uniref:hypothetical protein n=1 Tax=Pedobacter sp. KBW01 TaxID=2153364 RepID=UPI000F5A048B|nr:hypothetical protein [Pedobacter sp. KBW01]RQO78090.1 hypothetical protein DBR40_09070 [Pedobacter sp. KBW01]